MRKSESIVTNVKVFLVGLGVLLMYCTYISATEMNKQDILKIAQETFDAGYGKDVHNQYEAKVVEDEIKWIIHFSRKGIPLPGDHALVYVFKSEAEPKLLRGQ